MKSQLNACFEADRSPDDDKPDAYSELFLSPIFLSGLMGWMLFDISFAAQIL